jgi:23S rRNA (cytidine1920-2'-O)/16S rRNA (cytidine1409-2'-O)-methyltransferase
MRRRLDQAMVERGLAATRSRARDLIVRGAVSVASGVADKPGALVDADAEITVAADAGARYVSRGASKLEAALAAFGFSPTGRICLDVGASTGGFTQVLIERGARKVYAVDAGHGQLHATIAADPRVVTLEGTDARALTQALVPEPVSAIVADVSFISLAKAMPAAIALADPLCWLIALVKPQFEVGPAHVGKGGIVRDAEQRRLAVERVRSWLAEQGWRVIGDVPSPIAGGSGNLEHLIGAVLYD